MIDLTEPASLADLLVTAVLITLPLALFVWALQVRIWRLEMDVQKLLRWRR